MEKLAYLLLKEPSERGAAYTEGLLEKAAPALLAQKDVRDKLSAAGGEVEPGSAEAFANLLHNERVRYDKAIRAGNIKPD